MPAQNHNNEKIAFLLLLVVLLGLWFFGRHVSINTAAIQNDLKSFPLVYSGILFVVLYVFVTFFLFFSKDIFWIMGAVLFGPGFATFFICIAEIINAFILFHLARRLGRAYVQKQLSKKYEHLDEKLGKINFAWLFIFRAAPLIPYRFLDLGAGLTKIRFRRYLIAVALGSPIKMFWIEYILYGVGMNILTDPLAMIDFFLHNRFLLLVSMLYIGLVGLALYKISKYREG